jgi:hypothetical protein
VAGERCFESRPSFAAQAVSFQNRHRRGQLRAIGDAQDRRHQQIGSGEAVFQIIAAIEPIGKCGQTRLRHLQQHWAALLRPILGDMEDLERNKVLNVRLDRIERGEHPGGHAGAAVGVRRHQGFRPFGDVQDDGAGFKQRKVALFVDRHLAKRLQCVIGLPDLPAR